MAFTGRLGTSDSLPGSIVLGSEGLEPGVVQAGAATGTGIARTAVVSVSVNAEVATGSGSALDAQASSGTGVSADLAAGVGAAGAARVTVAPNASAGAGTGTAVNAAVSITNDVTASAGVAAGSGAALGVDAAVAPHAGLASGAGSAGAATTHEFDHVPPEVAEAQEVEAVIRYDGVDITSEVIYKSATFTSSSNGRAGSCSFRVRDLGQNYSFVMGREISLTIDGQRQWTGYLAVVRRGYFFNNAGDQSSGELERYYELLGADINILFQKRYLFNKVNGADAHLTTFPADTDDSEILLHYMANHLDLSSDDIGTSLVETVDAVSSDPDIFGGSGESWDVFMKMITFNSGAVYYIDPDREMVLTDVDTPNAPFALSDVPSGFGGGEGGGGYSYTDDFNRTVLGDGFEDSVGTASIVGNEITTPADTTSSGLWSATGFIGPTDFILGFDCYLPGNADPEYLYFELSPALAPNTPYVAVEQYEGELWLYATGNGVTDFVNLGPFTPGWYRVRAEVPAHSGQTTRAKVWPRDDPEPAGWDLETVRTTSFTGSAYPSWYMTGDGTAPRMDNWLIETVSYTEPVVDIDDEFDRVVAQGWGGGWSTNIPAQSAASGASGLMWSNSSSVAVDQHVPIAFGPSMSVEAQLSIDRHTPSTSHFVRFEVVGQDGEAIWCGRLVASTLGILNVFLSTYGDSPGGTTLYGSLVQWENINLRVRYEIHSTFHRIKVWKTVDDEPEAWTLTHEVAEGLTPVAFRVRQHSSHSGVNHTVTYDWIRVTQGIAVAGDSAGYREFELDFGGESLRNDALVWAAGQANDEMIFSRSTDEDSIETHGLWQVSQMAMVWRQITADRISDSYVYGSPSNHRGGKDDAVAVRLVIFRPGIRVGMKAEVESAVYDWSDVLPVRTVTMTFPLPNVVKFELVLSHEIDSPWSTTEFWWPDWAWPPFEWPRLGIPELGIPGLPGTDQCFPGWRLLLFTIDYTNTYDADPPIIGSHYSRDGDTDFQNYIEHSQNHQRWEVVLADSGALSSSLETTSRRLWSETEYQWDDIYHVNVSSATIDVPGPLLGWRRQAYVHKAFTPVDPELQYAVRYRFRIEVEAYINNRPRTNWSGGINNSDELWPEDTITVEIGLINDDTRETYFDVSEPTFYGIPLEIPLTANGDRSEGEYDGQPFSYGPISEHYYLSARFTDPTGVFATNSGRVEIFVTTLDEEYYSMGNLGGIISQVCAAAEPRQYVDGVTGHLADDNELEQIETPDGEDPTSTWYVTKHFFTHNSERIYLNGRFLRRGIDYIAHDGDRWIEILSSVTIVPGDVVTATYEIFLPGPAEVE